MKCFEKRKNDYKLHSTNITHGSKISISEFHNRTVTNEKEDDVKKVEVLFLAKPG